jgi:DNA-binding IclR family transcriptional regulator
MDDGSVTGRVLLILGTVARSAPVTLARLTRATGLPKPTVRRIANDLAARGMLTRTPEGYATGTDLRRLALRVTQDDERRRAAGPVLRELNRQTGQSAWLSLIDGTDLLTIEQVHGRRVPVDLLLWPRVDKLHGYVGSAGGQVVLAYRPDIAVHLDRLPARPATPYSPASVRQLTEMLRRVRDTGVAIEDEQYRLGYSCLAAPVRDPAGDVVGVIGVTGHTGTYAPARFVRTITAVAESLRDVPGGRP